MENKDIKKGLLIVLSGPSGVGKGTINTMVRERLPVLAHSISVTTRPPRDGEINGKNYFFSSKEIFERMIENNELLEWADYAGNYYGTPKKFVEEKLDNGIDVLLEIETKGALQIKNKFPEAICIFLSAPSEEELKRRIIGRGTESEEKIQQRLKIAKEEMKLKDMYDYEVINDKVEDATDQVLNIIKEEHSKFK